MPRSLYHLELAAKRLASDRRSAVSTSTITLRAGHGKWGGGGRGGGGEGRIKGCEDCGFAYHVTREVGRVDVNNEVVGRGWRGEGGFQAARIVGLHSTS